MESPDVQRAVVVTDRDPMGLHLRPAQLFVQLALRFESEIEVVRDSLRVDAKSIMHMMTLAAEPGTTLVIEACGRDAPEAVDALVRFVERGFTTDNETEGQSQAG